MSEPRPAQLLTSKCGPHCGVISSSEGGPTPPLVRHCDRCHEEYDFPMSSRPSHPQGIEP